MARYVLQFRGDDPPPADVEAIERATGVDIVDRVAQVLLVDASEEGVRLLRERLPAWTVEPEVVYRRPGPSSEAVADPPPPPH